MRLEGGIIGRVDDMVTIRGNNVFPSSLDAIIREIPDVIEYQVEVVTRQSMPHMKIEIEPASELFADPDSLESLMDQVEQEIKDRLNFLAEVILVPKDSLPRFELKGRRFRRSD